MTATSRAAAIAALTLTLSSLLAAGTPGNAAQPNRINTAQAMIVPFEGDNSRAVQTVPATTAEEAMPDAKAEEFDSLAAAVAAQDHDAADKALRCLAGAIYYEAQGEPLAGQLAVAEVVLNRAKSGRFPSDICAVITQRGQFGFVRGGTIPSINVAHAAWKRAVAVAKVALADAWNSPASNALYFNAVRRSPGARAIRVASIGNHIFYR